jgi:hypothetical protein
MPFFTTLFDHSTLSFPKLNDYYNEHQDPFFPKVRTYSYFFYVFIYLACLIEYDHIFYPWNNSTNDQNDRTTHFENWVVVVTAIHNSWELLQDCCNGCPSILEAVTGLLQQTTINPGSCYTTAMTEAC